MKIKHPSDSSEQVRAHFIILELINLTHKLKLEEKVLAVENVSFQIDGYSDAPAVLCEIYAHIGKLKVAQINKIIKDIFKMLLIEKMKGISFRKIVCFADEEAAKSFLCGKSWYSKIKDVFDVEFLFVEISEPLRNSLLETQKRQYR